MDIYADMDERQQKEAGAILEAVGGNALIDFKIAARLTRKQYKLVLEG